jgi:hypothetical protein
MENPRLDCVKKNKSTENFSLFGYNPAKNNKEDNCEMASEVSQQGQDLI